MTPEDRPGTRSPAHEDDEPPSQGMSAGSQVEAQSEPQDAPSRADDDPVQTTKVIPPGSRPRSTAGLMRIAFSIGVAAATLAIALDGGGYSLTSRHAVAIPLLWILAVGVGFAFWPREPIPVAALVVGGLLAAFALWTGLSLLWSSSAEKSFAELDRAIMYLALFAVVVLASSAVSGRRAWLRGLGLGIAAVGVLALASRLFPEQFADTSAVGLAQLFPTAARRLNYPVEYWNALATLIALGVPCLLWAATTERRALARALAVLPIPALSAALYLTSSRGGIAVSAIGVAVFVALARRWRALLAVVVAGIASFLAVSTLLEREALTSSVLAPGAAAQGREAALLIGLACLGAAVAHGMLSSIRLDLGRAARPAGLAVAAAGLAFITAVVVALDPIDRFERFKTGTPNAGAETLQAHLAGGSGNGRWQLWESAGEQFVANSVTGEGAGSYEAWWAENGTLQVFVRDAHSLYLETLGELGVIGMLLLGGALLVGLVVGIRRTVLADVDGRVAGAALVGAYVAWLVEAGIDWMWESTVVTLVAVVCLALLVGPATAHRTDSPVRRRRTHPGLRIAVPLVAVALVVAEGIPFLAQTEIAKSQSAVRAGDAEEALDAAIAAQRVQSWASSAHLQRALVEELRGNLPEARTAIKRALELDQRDWRLWVIDARIETKLEHFRLAARSLRRAVALNPRSQRFEDLPIAPLG